MKFNVKNLSLFCLEPIAEFNDNFSSGITFTGNLAIAF